MTGIVDYNAGNIRSVELALISLQAEYRISKNPLDLKDVERLIFPGVGEAKFAMTELKKTGFDSFLKDWAASGKQLLGICLGSQILFDYSEEGETKCLGLIPGCVRHFPLSFKDRRIKVPHMGWNDITYHNGGSPLFNGIKEGTNFYFVHSYYIEPRDFSVITATTDYGMPVPCAIKKGSIEAVQFHPEKSAGPGLQILDNFCSGSTKGNIC
ncbi:MAG TPA: imidazole glycerol phosphate synthase subunit HisH [Treponemataceae bacterium]|nr:imidazole glycerol phosphate synthase subunit HisH [Treponemataceae bacterium]